MPDMPAEGSHRYSAFISYSHADIAFASRLQQRLQGYRFPRRLARTAGRLRPVFRDRTGFAAAADLSDAVKAAITESATLIVVCSPDAAQSDYVAREIEQFRLARANGLVLAALIKGSPAQAFPAALLGPRTDGAAQEPLAADFRRQGDGSRLALLKLVAVLADLRLDELVQWDARRRVQQALALGAAALAGMAVMAALTLIALRARTNAEAERARGAALVESLLKDVREKLQGVGRLDLQQAVNRSAVQYFGDQNPASLPPATLRLRAELLLAIVDDDLSANDMANARRNADDAMATTTRLLRADPDDPQNIFAQSQSAYWEGRIAFRNGDNGTARADFTAYASLANRLIRNDPGNADWLMEVGYANSNLGTVALRATGDLPGAQGYFDKALTAFQQALHSDPSDPSMQMQVADGYRWLDTLGRLRGDYTAAITAHDADRAILDRLLAADPRNAEIRTGILSNQLAGARIDIARGALPTALAELAAGHAAALALQQGDPMNQDAAGQVRIFELFQARTWMMTGAPAPGIDAALGDCTRDARISPELATFCTILHARRLAQQGQKAAAARSLAPVIAHLRTEPEKYSARWGLDFTDEIAQVLQQPAAPNPERVDR